MTIFVEKLDLGGSGPTVGIKDSIDIAGCCTRAGSRALEDVAPASANADVVDGLLAAGYRIVGKTNLHELAFGTTGLNNWTGTPVNPLFPDYVPGGSSSGSAAAVAARLADVAIGTDTGGSVRIPASCCGVFGFKPSFGRVSRRGVMPAQTTLDCVGPFARDMDALIDCMRAIDPGFGALPDTADVRIGLLDVEARSEIRAAVEAAVRTSAFPYASLALSEFVPAYEAGLVIINAETWAACGSLVAGGKVGADIAARLLAASKTTAADVAAAERVRAAFTAQLDEALQQFQVLALPTMADAPPLLESGADTSKLVGMTSLVRPFNLSGHPAITIPLPARDGYPVSLQLVAGMNQDELLCAVARQLVQRSMQA
ncbi:amidase [Thauera sp.]|uniref:amidase n=1 Tax=Thauera sp. TaxID=1905334 RepID=UPI0039E279F2